ncbi:hypothetical protein L6452_03012 [Arctium lappa]|uniref:Uncharacterized protein n=1 Tax=Arctium lappa TaxID=4217 RepID=A0ACB9FL02_ARCLA|nr:hypothetical protein L6452_03012 [Arctium lappa]
MRKATELGESMIKNSNWKVLGTVDAEVVGKVDAEVSWRCRGRLVGDVEVVASSLEISPESSRLGFKQWSSSPVMEAMA